MSIDPANANYVYLGGTHGLWVSFDGGTNWAPLSADLTTGIPAGLVASIPASDTAFVSTGITACLGAVRCGAGRATRCPEWGLRSRHAARQS